MCQHHWLIKSPDGNVFVGAVCKHCGQVKEYRAAYEDKIGIWERTHRASDLKQLSRIDREIKEYG